LNAQTDNDLDEVSRLRQLLKERRELAAQGYGDYLPTVEDVLIELAFLHIERDEYSEALPLLEELLELAANGELDGLNVEAIEEELAQALEALADEYYDSHDYNTAEKHYLRSLEVFEKLVKNDIPRLLPDVARLYSNIGRLYHNIRKDYRAAEKYSQRALQLHEKLAKEQPNKSLIRLSNYGIVLRNIGYNYHVQKKYGKAEPYYLRSQQIREQLAQEQPDKYLPWLAKILEDMGSNLLGQKKYSDAIKQYQRRLQICKQLFDKDAETHSTLLATAYGNFSWAYLFLNRYDQSETAARKVLELDDTQLWTKVNLAHALLLQNRFSEAEEIYLELSQTIDINDKTFTPAILDDFKVLQKANVFSKKHQDYIKKIKKMVSE
jgi:tetratricopeptide (TPR) repeat protein